MKEPFLEGHTSVAATEFSTIVEILQWRAFHHPDQKAYAFFTYGEEEYGLTYAALERKSRAIGAMLQKLGASGERVLLLYPPELDYISAFFGCLYAGAIAVPAYPPHSSRSIERVQSIVADAQAKFVLTTRQMKSKIQRSLSLVPDLEALQWIVTDQEGSDADETDWHMPQITESTIAFLQYTSGSTAAPKGVMVSHSNLLSNHRMIQSAMAHPVESVGSPFVSWLPLFHDMGLISKMLQSLYIGSSCIFLPSYAFLQSPFRWLQTISLYQASTSGAPNFAYDLCVQKITPEQRDTLDLRSWQVAFCGAEPIRSQTLKNFATYFAPCGFRIEALKPVYGLAEATVFVTNHPRNLAPVVRLLQKEAFEQNHVVLTTEMDEKHIECTSCGKPELDARVVIVDPETCMFSASGNIGEIWIAGSHVAQGYWNRHEETEETFRAFVKKTGEGPFLRTGDLGFLLDDNLFITGRQKDLIIIRGQNYYPQDIENVAELSHPALKSNASAAFSLEVDGNERVILVMEIDRQYRHQEPQELFVAIRQAVFEKYNVHVYAIVLIKPGSMLRTSSGKIQRRACRTAFLEQNLAIMFADLPQGVKGLLEPRAGDVAFASPPMQTIQSVPMQRSPLEIVAVQDHTLTGQSQKTGEQAAPLIPSENKHMQFSLLYFSSNESEVAENKYELLLEGAKFADHHDFTAVWVPERHFHPFGGLYPNPSTLASALAVTTQKIRLRAGSVVLPMHHPIRVAEEWSVVDNLSSGRVDLAFAIGWNPNDFVLAPTQYEKRKDLLFSGIEMFQKLWHGDEILFPNGLGKETAIKIYPLPVQSTLTPWITCTSSPERFREAGAIGANVLTALLFQSREELAEKINAYRDARAQHGYDPGAGHVTLMMHTFIGDDLDEVRQIVRPAFISYLKSSVDLWRQGVQKLNDLTSQEQEQVLSYAFERYFQTHALFGTPQTAIKIIEDLSAIGVDEIACLIDFGIDNETVMDGLHFLNSLRKRFQKGSTQPKKRMGEPKNAVSLQKTQRQILTTQSTKNDEDEKHTLSQSALFPAYTNEKNAHSEQGGTPVKSDRALLQQLSLAPLSQQLHLLEEYIQQQIAQVLELSAQDISGVLNIRSLGLDSLMIMNIVNNCQRDLLMTVDAGQFYEHTSFRSLALYMIEELHRAHPTEKRTALAKTDFPLLPRHGPRTTFPASFAQQRLWFLHQLQLDATAYNVLILLGIKGDLVVDALEWSLKEIIHRHEILRTSLTLHEGQPVQVVHETTGFTLSQIALNHLPSEAWDIEVHKLARQESQHPFDLTQGSLLRAKLLLLDQHEYTLLFTYHHVVIDGWSRSILLRELQALYTAYIADQPSPLENLSIQYADYTLWQRQWLSRPLDREIRDTSTQQENQRGSEEGGQILLEQQLTYWKTQLAGPLPLLALPTDSPRPAIQTFHGAHHARQLPVPLMDALKKLSKGEEVTLFMTLLASFQVLLARYSGQDDILIGTLIAGRNRAEIEPLIGFFLNTLVLRTNLAGNPTFHDLLQRVRNVCLGAYAHQDVPFEQIVEVVHPERDLSRHPLFQVMFLLEETSWWLEAELPGVSLQQIPTESGLSLFDLTCSITAQGLTEIEYNTDLFAASTIERLLHQWQLLLQQIIAQPYLPLSALSVVSPQEREMMLETWNQTRSPNPGTGSLPQQLAEWADRTPDRIALSFQEEQLSYGELDQRASRLARHLQEQGAGPEAFVAIFAERSPALIVGILAVFKVGGAYIPLDPATPSQRLAQILAEARPPLVLTTRELATHLPPVDSTSLVWLETIGDPLSQSEPSWHQEDGDRQQLAYVIYTSGSTGKPKGVMIHQQGMLNHLVAKIEDLGLQAQDCVAQNASTSFDISIWQMWSGLMQGGRVHVLSSEEAHLPLQLWRCLHEQAITILQLVPSLLRLLLDALEGEKVRRSDDGLFVRVLLATGEALPSHLSQRWIQQYPGVALVNAYGPTECSDDVTHAWLEADLEQVPIGRPLRNTHLYPLDRWMELVPVGMVGELYVGGEGVGRGYLFAAEQTARSFVPDPWSPEPGARLYRTGDLVRYWEDGQLEYLGRVDEQVKLRGYRIELGEIEAVVRTYPTIQEAVLLVREDDAGEKCLVAYVVREQEGGGETFVERDLRAYVQEKLPEYMVPMYFVELMALPLTPNGKVDRRSLPAPEKRVFTVEQNNAIRTPIEEIILGIYRTVLGMEQVSLHKSFFDQGGHSLSAIQVISRLREVLHIELPLKSLFEKPSVVELAQQIDRQMHRQQGQVLPPILPVSREQDLPLSFAQQRLWFLHQLEPQSIAYLLPGKYRLRGVLDVQSLEKSLQELINRHESLRTTFEERVGQPIQIIHAAELYTLVVIDLQGLRHADREEHARCVAQMEAQHPCDLVTGPLLRTALLRLERQEHILLLTQHHIIADEWSGEIFVRELTLLYRAFMIGRPSSLTPLPIQYADYTLWQRGWLQGEVLEAQLAYWRGQLANMVPLELPADHPRQAVQTLQGAVQSLLLPLALSEALVMVSQQEQVTMFMTLLAAWQVLLQRYTGQHDISVGTPIANRRQVETENIIGFFVNTLVMRSDLSGDPTFAQVLQRTREVCLEAYAHQDVPFEQVVEDLAPARDMSRSPLFQVMLVLQNTPQEQMELAGLQVLPLVIESVVSKFDLTLLLSETEQGLHCILEYNTDLFEAATIQRLLSHWQTILQGIVQNPQAHLWELPLLTLEEQEHLLIHWNATQAVVPQELCVHQLFEQQVERTPEAVALVCEDEALTYGELNRRANQVAHSLQTLGVGPEVLVGLYVERSLHMLMGILGILKAGGAYVPLDPRYPSARVAFLLEDAQMSVLVTQQSVQESLPPWHGHILCLDRDWLLLDCQKKTDLSLSLCLEQSAYIIYTSGSTGQPKGVQVSHANVTRLFHTTAHSLALSKNDIWTMFHSYAFDFSVWEIWGAFLYGGRLIVVPYWVTRSPDIFYNMLEEQAVTVLNQTPSAFQQVMQGEETQQVGKNLALRLIIFGGEALNPKSLSPWIRRHGFQHTQLVNMYGITETTVHVTSHFLTKTDLEEDRSSCIGRPLPDLQCYILDGYQQLLPVGLPGELYVGGMGLARGYVHRPELSAERFVPHPWSQVPGARLYRTGDLVQYRSDGTLEYLGRIDQQVKLRGYRIELGEIEMVLRRHQAVCEVAVVAREDRQGEKRLVAYVVGSEKLTSQELRGYLQDKLPEYMVPAFFVPLKMLPLTSHGKVERRMLPVPEEVEERVYEELQGAMTPIEELLVEIWSEVLARTQIGPHDNFFELGGHSLLATQLIARVRQVLEVEIPLRAVFEAPALGEFARYIEQTLRNNKGLRVPLFVPQERPEEIPLSFAQQRLWFLDQLEPGSTAYLLPGALRFVGNLNIKVLERSVEQLLCRHEILRTTFVGRSGQPVQVIHPATNYCLPVIDLQDVRSQEQGPLVQRLASQEAHSPCDLANGPLLRMSVLRLQPQEHAVLLTLHHIITDGWSNEVIVGELTTLYQVYLTEQSSWLRPSPLQYADYALWQQRWLQGEVLNAHLDYWTEQLRGASPLELPGEHRPGLARAINRGAVHTFKLSSALYQDLMALSHREGVTLFMTLLAAFQILLQRYTGMSDIVVGTDIANRTSIETEKMVGFFVNLLALRIQLSDQETFCEMLKRERSMVLDAYAHQDLPFEKLIDALQFVRDEHQSAFINVLFVLQNVPRQVIELPGLTVSVMETQVNTAKFDVAVFLTEEAQELTGSVNYRTDLFDMERMVRLVRHFEVLLQNITASPSIPIKHLEMFTEEEKERKVDEEGKKRKKRARNLKDAKRRSIALLPDN